MSWRILLPVLFLAAALLPVFPAPSAQTLVVVDAVWGTPSSPEKAIPGDENIQLSLVVANIGNKPICTLEAQITPAYPGTALPFESWDGSDRIRAYMMQQIPPGSMTVLSFRLNVFKDTVPGRYPASVRLLYRECTSTQDTLPTAQTTDFFTVQIWAPPVTNFLEATWFVDGAERPVGPGTGVAVLKISIEAPKDTSISNIEGRLSLPEGFRPAGGQQSLSAVYQGVVTAGGTFSLSYPLLVSDQLKPGTYTFELTLRFRNKYGTHITNTIIFPAEVFGREELAIESSSETVIKGGLGYLPVKVLNKGTASAYNLDLEVRADKAGILLLETSSELGVLSPGQEVNVRLPVYVERLAETGLYTVTATLSYRDGLGNLRSKQFKISLNVADEFRPGLAVEAGMKYVAASAETPLELSFTNRNPYPISDVKITISTTSSQVSILEGPTSINLKTLGPGESHKIRLTILSAPAAADSISLIKASVEYRDKTSALVVENFDVPVAVRADLNLQFKGLRLSPAKVRPGEVVDLAGDVVNLGTGVARSVSVEVVGDPPFQPFGDTLSFVGLVNPSQVSAFTINFRVAEDARPGRYNVKVKATYRNGFGESFVKEEVLSYEVLPAQAVATNTVRTTAAAQGSVLQTFAPYLLVAALAVIAVATVRRRKKGR
jgi:hypothetical protein